MPENVLTEPEILVAPPKALKALRGPRKDRGVIAWDNLIGMSMIHLVALAGVAWIIFVGVPWQTIALGAVFYTLSGFAITAGYHRLFSHRTYRAAGWLRGTFLAFGAAALQNSALEWCADHRRHHRSNDDIDDPYSVRDGFWWAHMGWVLHRGPFVSSRDSVRDLAADPLVAFQARHCLKIAVVFGFVLPMLIGLLWNDMIGALLVAGFIRVVLQWHSTFLVNSLAHWKGPRPFAPDSTARDTIWVALLSFGEGYHNFHHRFQSDYRNGFRWFHYDPSKWLVATLSLFGATSALKRVPALAIEQARTGARAIRAERRAAKRAA